jgi:ABC transporter substrate binding protein
MPLVERCPILASARGQDFRCRRAKGGGKPRKKQCTVCLSFIPTALMLPGGGLISYGPSVIEEYKRAADYFDRILRGDKPADLPVQAPTKYEMVLNMKTAEALGLQVPDVVRLRDRIMLFAAVHESVYGPFRPFAATPKDVRYRG